MLRLAPDTSSMEASITLPTGRILRHVQSAELNASEFPNATSVTFIPKKDESNCERPRVLNACGVIVPEQIVKKHKAWVRQKSIFGLVCKAFTIAGNIIVQGNLLSFKGAKCRQTLSALFET